MKTIGIIGGIAPPSTIEYYKGIITGYQTRTGSRDYPPILINSINMTRMLDLIGTKDFTGVVDYLGGEINKLKMGGADFAILASNTPHAVFDALAKESSIPLLSIVEATLDFCNRWRIFFKVSREVF